MPASRRPACAGAGEALYPLGIGLMSAALSKLKRGEPLALALAAQVATEGRYYTYTTLEEWADFKRRGWRAVYASDLDEVFSALRSL